MARSFSREDAKRLILQHEQLRSDLHEIADQVQTAHRADAEKAASNLLNSRVFAEGIVDDLRRGQIRAPKTFDTLALMAALYKIIHCTSAVDHCRALSDEYDERIRDATRALSVVTSPLRSFFAGSRARASAEAAYDALSSHAAGDYGNAIRQSVAEVRQARSISNEAAFSDYEANPAVYQQALRACAPSDINADKPLSEMIPIITRHKALLEQYRDASTLAEQKLDADRQDIRKRSEKALTVRVMEQLRGLEVESLSQRRSGIRVKALRDAGYNTIADVYSASIYNLASIYGISEDAANIIKAEARKMAADVQKTVKLKISADERTPESTDLLTGVYAYIQDRTVVDAAEPIEKPAKVAVDAMDGFGGLKNIFSWMFLPDTGRAYYADLYGKLSSLIDGDYPQTVANFHARAIRAAYYSTSGVWEHFSGHSIAYFNILEEIVPGLLGNGDTLYGLPEDLAREIQDQTFFPQGLKVTLRRYQEWGVKYILHQERALLGDEMGLGKTVQALGTMVSLRNTGATHFMVVCPASVLPNWCKEIDRKSEFRACRVHGSGRQAAIDDWVRVGGVTVTTYETTSRIAFPEDFRFDLLVVDEAHYIKNTGALRSQSVRKLSQRADRLLFMTGTALENKVDEMISLIEVLRPALADRVRNLAFMASAPQFREQVAPVYYRRKRDDVLTELPEVINNEEMCELLPEEEALYESAVLSKNQTGIRRVSWTAPELNRSSKARRMREIIEDAEEDGRRILVFSFYRDTLKAIANFLGERCTQIINGSVPVERRQQIIDEFETMPAGSVLLSQIGAGGTGLNIQAASVVIICEPQLKPSTENQAIARAHRMGQSRNVLVYRLIAANTIDERIEDMLREKQAIFDEFADKSAAADATKREESQIDDKTLGKLILDEIDRINAKNGVKKPDRASAEPSEQTVAAQSAPTEKRPLYLEAAALPEKTASSSTDFPTVDALVAYLSREGFDFVDNRPKNGCLWIQADVLPDAKAIRIDGDPLPYSKASRALHGAAGCISVERHTRRY